MGRWGITIAVNVEDTYVGRVLNVLNGLCRPICFVGNDKELAVERTPS